MGARTKKEFKNAFRASVSDLSILWNTATTEQMKQVKIHQDALRTLIDEIAENLELPDE